MDACLLLLYFSFSELNKEICWEERPQWPILCRVGHKTLTQSNNQFCSTTLVWTVMENK